MKLNNLRTGIIIYLFVAILIGFFSIQDIFSPDGPWIAERANEQYFECFSPTTYLPSNINCFEKALAYDTSLSGASWYIKEEYGNLITNAWGQREISNLAIYSVRYIYYSLHYYSTLFGPIPWGIWIIVGLYILLYDRVSDLAEKIMEGLISGTLISLFFYVAQTYLLQMERQETDCWHNDCYGSILIPRVATENLQQVLILASIFLIIWSSVDLLKRKPENIVTKAALFIVGLITFLIFPVKNEVRYFVAPLTTLAFAIAYYYWRELNDRRKQTTVVVFLLIAIGMVTATIKHWGFLTEDIILGNYTHSELAEVVTDFLLFLLGFFITFLELNKNPVPKENQQSAQITTHLNSAPPPIVKEHFQQEKSPVALWIAIGIVIGVFALRILSLMTTGSKGENSIISEKKLSKEQVK
jgi:hypothetical protein